MYPTTPDEPLGAHTSATLCDVVAAPPVPESETLGDAVALLAMLIAPLTLPEVVGLKATVKVALWLGVRINPELIPEALNPAPLRPTLEMVMFELPVFCNATVCEAVVLRLTVPNARLEGVTLSV